MEATDYREAHDDWTFRNIVHISHGDFFRALDLNTAGLGCVKAAAEAKDWDGAYDAWDDYFRNRKQHLVHFDPERYRRLAEHRPRRVRETLAAAADVCNHRIRWYGHRLEQFGDIVNFSPGTDRSALYGYHYWYWAYPLLWAYALNGGERYVRAFDELFNQWYDQRDSVEWRIRGTDPIWYELGLCRCHRFIAFYSLMQDEDELGRITRQRLMRTLLGHGRALYGFQRERTLWPCHRGARPGRINFQFSSNHALIHLALFMPELKESRRWLSESFTKLRWLFRHGVYADGANKERCPSYASFSVAFATEVCRLLDGFPEHRAMREWIGERLIPCYEWYMHIATPLGEFPPVGDAKTRSAVPFFSSGINALGLENVCATVAPNLPRIRREQLPIQYSHRMREADLSDRASDRSALPAERSVHYPESDWTVMRSSWRPDAHYLLINHGPYAGHAHLEALAFNMYAFGEPQALELDLAVTRGYDDPRCRNARSSMAHNMVVLDGESIPLPSEEDQSIDLRAAQDPVWYSDDSVDYFEAWHGAYRRTKGAVVRRKIVFVKPWFWLIHDRITLDAAASPRAKTATWYLHACHPFVSRKSRWVTTGRKSRLHVIPASPADQYDFETGLESRIDPKLMATELYQNYYPTRYFMSLTQRLLRANCPHDFCVVLFPQRRQCRDRIEVRRIPVHRNGKKAGRESAEAWEISHGRRRHVVALNHDATEVEFEVCGEAASGRACVIGGDTTYARAPQFRSNVP